MHKTICSNYNSSFIWLEVKGPPLRQRDLCAAALPAGWWQLGQPRSLPGQVWTRKCFSSGFAVFLILHFCMDSKFGEWNNHSWFVQKDFNLFEVGGKDAEAEPAFLCLKIHSQQRNFCGISSPVAWKQDWIQCLMNQSKMVLRSNPETLLEKKNNKKLPARLVLFSSSFFTVTVKSTFLSLKGLWEQQTMLFLPKAVWIFVCDFALQSCKSNSTESRDLWLFITEMIRQLLYLCIALHCCWEECHHTTSPSWRFSFSIRNVPYLIAFISSQVGVFLLWLVGFSGLSLELCRKKLACFVLHHAFGVPNRIFGGWDVWVATGCGQQIDLVGCFFSEMLWKLWNPWKGHKSLN